MDGLVLRDAVPADAAACLAIYAPFARDTAVSLEEEPPSRDDMAGRIAGFGASHGWLVAERAGVVVGYAYGSPFRSRWGYRHTVEIGGYVAPGAVGQGIGRALYEALFERFRADRRHAVIAAISGVNPASVAFHEALGFRPVGMLREIGHKRGQWVDVGLWHRLL